MKAGSHAITDVALTGDKMSVTLFEEMGQQHLFELSSGLNLKSMWPTEICPKLHFRSWRTPKSLDRYCDNSHFSVVGRVRLVCP